MKKEGLRRSLDYLIEQGVSIITIATDRHRVGGALIKSDYVYISHQYGVWYMTKGIVHN